MWRLCAPRVGVKQTDAKMIIELEKLDKYLSAAPLLTARRVKYSSTARFLARQHAAAAAYLYASCSCFLQRPPSDCEDAEILGCLGGSFAETASAA